MHHRTFSICTICGDDDRGGGRLVDLGCGNGRDALFFADIGLDVVAIDLSDAAIRMLQSWKERIRTLSVVILSTNLFISRRVMITHIVDSRFMQSTASRNNCCCAPCIVPLNPVESFFIEVRGIHDPLYGKGSSRNATLFYNNHYRRFIVMDELVAALRKIGFRVEYAQERHRICTLWK